jgi:DnaJ-class molecular chaperone
MAGKGLYAVLGIEEGAGLPTIRRAYRRLVFSVHPDVGATPDPERFHEIHEAYEILTDPERRRSGTRAEAKPTYRRQMAVEPAPLSAERRAVRVPDDFATTMPSIGEFLDHVAQNFFGFHRKSHGPYRRLGIEVLLSPEEARSGCRVPLEVPNFERCPRCSGLESGWGVCVLCHGYGLVEGTARVALDIPPGIRDGQHYEVSLASAGIENLLLAVTILTA